MKIRWSEIKWSDTKWVRCSEKKWREVKQAKLNKVVQSKIIEVSWGEITKTLCPSKGHALKTLSISIAFYNILAFPLYGTLFLTTILLLEGNKRKLLKFKVTFLYRNSESIFLFPTIFSIKINSVAITFM